MFLEVEVNEGLRHYHNSLHRQRDSKFDLTQIDNVYKQLGITTKKKQEIEEEVIEDLS
jgi:hypothetical protein